MYDADFKSNLTAKINGLSLVKWQNNFTINAQCNSYIVWKGCWKIR